MEDEEMNQSVAARTLLRRRLAGGCWNHCFKTTLTRAHPGSLVLLVRGSSVLVVVELTVLVVSE